MVGTLAVSTAAPLVRLAIGAAGIRGPGFSLVLAGARLLVAALVLAPNWRAIIQSPPKPTALKWAIAAGLALAFHFAAWITSLSYTAIAASTALVTTNPVWVALLGWFWLGEKPRRQALVGIAIALTGGLLIGLGDLTQLQGGSNPLLGDGLALLGAWAVSFYFLLGREAQRQGLGIHHYITIAYTVAAIVLFPLPFLVGATYADWPLVVYGYMLLMALLPQLVGHTSFNWALRWVPPTLVTLVILFEPVLASVLAYWLFAEIPSGQVLLGAVVLLVGVAIAAIS